MYLTNQGIMAKVKIKTMHLIVGAGVVLGVVYFADIGGMKGKIDKLLKKGGKGMKDAAKEEAGLPTSFPKPMTGQPLAPVGNTPSPINQPLAYAGYRTRYYNPRAYAVRRTGLFGGIQPNHAFLATQQSEGRYNIMPSFEFDYRPYPTP